MSEYKINNNNSSEYKRKAWDMAIGLQAVDDLKPSEYLYELAKKNISGQLTNEEIESLLYKKYDNESLEDKLERKNEADIVANRIAYLLSDNSFSFSPISLKNIHGILFNGIYDHAGQYRNCNISKSDYLLQVYGRCILLWKAIQELRRFSWKGI